MKIKATLITIILFFLMLTANLVSMANTAETSGLNTVREVKTYNYTYNDDKKQTPHVGTSANSDEGDIFYTMINSIKELDKIVQGLVNDVKSLFVRIKEINTKIIALIKINHKNTKELKSVEAKNRQLKTRMAKLEG